MCIDDRIMACLQWFKESGGFGPGPQQPPQQPPPSAPALVPTPQLQPPEERRGHDRGKGKFQRVPADSSNSSDDDPGMDTQPYEEDVEEDRVLLDVASVVTGRYDRAQMQCFLLGVLPSIA